MLRKNEGPLRFCAATFSRSFATSRDSSHSLHRTANGSARSRFSEISPPQSLQYPYVPSSSRPSASLDFVSPPPRALFALIPDFSLDLVQDFPAAILEHQLQIRIAAVIHLGGLFMC